MFIEEEKIFLSEKNMDGYEVNVFGENYVLIRLVRLLYELSLARYRNEYKYREVNLSTNLIEIHLDDCMLDKVRALTGIKAVYRLRNSELLMESMLVKTGPFRWICGRYVSFSIKGNDYRGHIIELQNRYQKYLRYRNRVKRRKVKDLAFFY
ncbi:hypothetical protein FACS189472_11190 [Alphaproteobacteria bacterium]|nr:hypothetical protein FACS189472_11190 [Alphaproteobacteria bacterium]